MLERKLPKVAADHLYDGLFGGEADSGSALALASPDEFRGWVALTAYYLGTPNPGYRTILQQVWQHEAGYLQSFGDLGLIRRMFRAGRYEVPLSGVHRVYRGVAGVDVKEASNGISWTTSRDVACWFAMREAYGERQPLVIAADIDAAHVVYYSNGRSEHEVIFGRRVVGQADPDRASWEAAAERNK
jgi:hypothetical protein